MIFEEENHIYKIDFSNAIWATDQLNKLFHNAKTELSDVDFIAETDNTILFVEYKNANIPNASSPSSFSPTDNKKITQIVKKYYDSLIYIYAIGKHKEKKKKYIYILEYPLGDVITRKLIRNRLQTKLPFLLQEQNSFNYKLIDEVSVLSIYEWNSIFSDFPLTRV